MTTRIASVLAGAGARRQPRSRSRAGSARAATPRPACRSSRSTTAAASTRCRSSRPPELANYQTDVLRITTGCAVRVHRRARRVAGQGPVGRAARRDDRGRRLGRRSRSLSDAAQAPHDGVPARGRAPAAAHQRDRRGHPRAPHARAGGPPVLPRARLLLDPHADHHGVRRRGRRPDVPGLDARRREPAAHARRQGRLRPGLLRPRDPAHRVGPAQRRDLLPGDVARSTRSARRSAPRTPTRAATSPSSG